VAHLQLIDPADLPRFAALGVIANLEPLWAQPDPLMTELTLLRVGAARGAQHYQIRSLLRSGAAVSFGSDWPVTAYQPLAGVATAVTRQTPGGYPDSGWLPAERVTATEALAAYSAGVAPLAIMIGGIGAPAGYLIAGLILTVFAVAFTAMSIYIHNAGAFYSYIARGLGKPAGLGAAALAVFSYNAIQIGVYGAFGYFAAITAKDLTGADLPWWTWAAIGIAVVWFFGHRSIHAGAKVLGTLLIAETGILALLAAAILVKGGAHGLSLASFAPAHIVTGGMGSVLALAFGAFIGFEATAIYREEARTPNRTVPRATYVAVGFLGLFYAFISWVIIQAFGNTGAVQAASEDPAGMFFTAMNTYVGSWATDLMRVLIVTSLFAALLAFHNAITRYTYALASEGALPRQLGRIHPVHKSPYIAGLAQTGLAAIVVAAPRCMRGWPPPTSTQKTSPSPARTRSPARAQPDTLRSACGRKAERAIARPVLESADAAEGLAAFTERRRPHWSGR
jgi:hypothetical protein